MGKFSNKAFRELGITPPKSAAQMQRENNEAAKNLPTDIKKKFWSAMTKDGKNLGEARKEAGIDLMVAAALVIQLHDTYHIPMKVEDIN